MDNRKSRLLKYERRRLKNKLVQMLIPKYLAGGLLASKIKVRLSGKTAYVEVFSFIAASTEYVNLMFTNVGESNDKN